MDEDGVSPLVATVLMLAITVVVGGGVMLLAKGFSPDESGQAVHIIGQRDEVGDSWRLVRAPPDVPSSDILWRGGDGVRYATDTAATSASPLVPTDWTAVGGAGPWAAGTRMSFCADGAAAVHDWSFELLERQRGTYVASIRFATIAPCL